MGIKLFKKNYIDLDFDDVTITVTDATATGDGSDYTDFLRNRDNTSGWATTGSDDAANTQVDFDLGLTKDITDIMLVEMNFKAYTIQYYDEDTMTYVDFSTAINVTGNTTATKSHSFTQVSARYLRLIITGTFVADEDKYMTQFFATKLIGELSYQPRVKPVLNKNRKVTKYLSGKSHVIKTVQAFQCEIDFQSVTTDAQLAIIEELFDSFEGFQIWLCGGTTTQFTTASIREGWRLQDIFLVNVVNEYEPEWADSRYAHGMDVKLKLAEIV